MNARFLGLALALMLAGQATAQVTTRYYENFDTLPHTVVSTHTLPGPIPYWNDTAAVSVSPTNSYHSKVVVGDTVYFTTSAFSTQGWRYVLLSFDHIAKVFLGQRAMIQVSVDNGATWTNLTATHYRGSSPQFAQSGFFNEYAYSNSTQSPYWPSMQPVNNTWWKHEEFDISALAGQGVTGNLLGFANVRLRFALKNSSINVNREGWFVDNIRVEGALCDPRAPVLDWSFATAQNPIGARYTPTTTVRVQATDQGGANSGILGGNVVYRINGGAWDTLQATMSGALCSPVAVLEATIACNPLDTVDYYVLASDCSCSPNQARLPAQPGSYYTFWREDVPPLMCGTSSATSLPLVVNQVPYLETFDSPLWLAGSGNGLGGTLHRGSFPLDNPPTGRNYVVNPSSLTPGYGWSVRTGPTPTPNTGPVSDHTTGAGNYLYTESSQGGSSSVTTFITPCIKFDTLNHPALEFYYHKFGTHMGPMSVDIDTGMGFVAGSFVQGAFWAPGATHTSSSDAWSSAMINLQPYLGKYIRLRFVGIRPASATLTMDEGDMAVDDLLFYEAPQTDVRLDALLAPRMSGVCTYSGQELVRVRLASRGYQAPPQVAVAVSVKNLTTGTTVVVRDTVAVTWNASRMATIDLGATLNLSAFATFEVQVWTEVAGDGDASNDSLPLATVTSQQPLALPYFENFNGPNWVLGNHVGTSFSAANLVSNAPVNPTGQSMYSFYVGRDLAPTAESGPRWSRGFRGKYVYADLPNPTSNFVPTVALLETRCVDLTTATQPSISFWYHMFGAGCSSIVVDVFDETVQNWVPQNSYIVTAPAQSQETDDWRFLNVPLTAYAGSVVRVRVRANRTTVSWATAAIAIDDLRIFDRDTIDVGVHSYTMPGKSFNLTSPQNVVLQVRNYGAQPVSAVPVVLKLTSLCSGVSTTYTQTVTNLAAGATYNMTFSGSTLGYVEGDMLVSAFTSAVGDVFAGNDTALRRLTVVSPQVIPFALETFENCASGTNRGFFALGGTGTLQMWELGTSTKGIPAASGINAWHTGLTQNPTDYSTEYLRFPPFVGFDTTLGAELRFKQRFVSGNSGAANLQYFLNGSWVTVPASTSASINGYQFPYGSTSIFDLGGEPGWAGTTGSQYITTSIPLSFWSGNSLPLIMRFHVVSWIATQWAIDDIEIVVPPQRTVSLDQLATVSALLVPGDSVQFSVRVTNDGVHPVSSLELHVDNLGSPATVLVPIQPPLPATASRTVVIPTKFWIPAAGTYAPCVSVSKVNNRLDGRPVGDTSCTQFVVQQPVVVTAASPFCADFESTAWNTGAATPGTSWVLGVPNQGSLVAAYNGTKAYAVNPGTNYGPNAWATLNSPSMVLDSGQVYELSFAHNMQSEPAVDGGGVQYSFDGITWFALGSHQEPGSVNWLTEPSVVALGGESGWSRSWSGYQMSSVRFTVDAPNVWFRWVFASSALQANLGWTVDQVCIEPSTAPGPAVELKGQGARFFTGCL